VIPEFLTSSEITDIYNNILKIMPVQSFLDLKKAFDTVNHDVLLQNLYKYGIRGNASDLMKSYLANRIQYIVADKLYLTHFKSNWDS